MNHSPAAILDTLKAYDHILLTGHVNPDGDAIGSLVAMQEFLEGLGKQVVSVVDDDIDDKFLFLDGAKKIVRPDVVETDATWLFVVLDATAADRTGDVEGLIKGPVLNIDHHVSNLHFADVECVQIGRAHV